MENLVNNILKSRFVTFHSSECRPGCVFVATRGAKVDGHSYLAQAKELGSEFALVEEGYAGDSYGLTLLRVKSPLAALQEAASECMKTRRAIAITGSCGKTTTKEYLHAMLCTKFHVAKTEGSRNSQIGLPTGILNMDDGYDFYVLELGMSCASEMDRLVRMVRPEISAITMIGTAHRENFASHDELATEKGKILVHPHTKKGYLGKQVYTFPHVIEMGTCEKICVEYEEKTAIAHLPKHHQEDALLALAIAKDLGVDEDKALESIQAVQDEKRFYVHNKGGVHWIIDAYNASPEAVVAALKSFPDIGARRGAILGDMRELGASSEEGHKHVAEAATTTLDYLLSFGEPMSVVHKAMLAAGKESSHFKDKAALLDAFKEYLQKDDIVLVKGPNVEKLWEVPTCYCL